MASDSEYDAEYLPWYRRCAEGIFGIDTRSLAVFRIVIAALVLIDLYVRWSTMIDFQTDQGFFTRKVLLEFFGNQGLSSNTLIPDQPLPFWSLHLVSGALWFQQLLLVIVAVAAGLMLIGWQTRWMTFVVWILTISLHVRNPIVLNSGDTLLRMLLFWSIFLPLNARWSVDKLIRPALRFRPAVALSVASAAIILQLCIMYWFTGLSKANPVWFDGRALENVLNLDLLTRPWGKRLLAYPELLKFMTFATLYGELILPLLLFIPWRTHYFRMLNIALFWGFHLGVVLTMSVGLFSAISMTAWLLLLPKQFWESGLVRGVMGSFVGSAALIEEDYVGRRINPEDDRPAWLRFASYGVQAMLAVALVYVTLWNISRIRLNDPTFNKFMPAAIQAPGSALMFCQEFKMFDVPPAIDYWFIYEARLRNGELIDLFDGSKVIPNEKPSNVFGRYRDHRWRRLHANLQHPEYVMLRKPITEYLIRRWNETHSEDFQVVRTQLKFYQRRSDEDDKQQIVYEVWADIAVEGEDPVQQMLESLQGGGSLLP